MPAGNDYTPLEPSPDHKDLTFIALPDPVDGETVYRAFPNFSAHIDTQKKTEQDVYKEKLPAIVQIVNGVVTPELQVLLSNILSTIDASIPNKDQNRAVRHLIRKAFDDSYFHILRLSYPDMIFAYGPDYAVQPKQSRGEAIMEASLKMENQSLHEL